MKPGILTILCLFSLCACGTGKYVANETFPSATTAYTPNGILEEVFHPTSVPGPTMRRMLVYLPADYYGGEDRYPVLYLLHGARGNETSWIFKGRLLETVDSLTTCGAMAKTIIVMPNLNQYDNDGDYGRSRCKGAVESVFEIDGSAEYAFAQDVVATVDRMFRTIPEKSGRAIAGLSIGGFQAIHLSASYPDMFDYIGAFSPFTRTIVKRGEHSDFFRCLRRRLDVQFTDPPELYWIMTGKNDIFQPRIQEFLSLMDRKGYLHKYHESAGGHSWDNWEAYCCVFMKNLWKNN